MRDLWLVAKHEYVRTVIRRGFLIGTLAVPLGIAALVVLTAVAETLGEDRSPVGYVDHAGVLEASRQAALSNAADRIPIRAFTDELTAQAALEREEIQAFFVLPATYPESLTTELYYLQRPPSAAAWQDFDDFVRLNLISTWPAGVQERVLAGPDIVVRDIASGREFSERGIINILLPVAASALLFINTMSASGYLLRVVADEKENRTMEIMLTALTSMQLIGGKAAGLLAVVLTQLGVYTLTILLGLLVAGQYLPELREAVVPWVYLGVMALFFPLAFALLTAAMVAIGAAMPDLPQGQQMAGLLSLAFMAPLFLLTVLIEDPSHPLVVFLTLFPTSAFLTISLRWGLGVVPVWQMVASWVILAGSVLALVWAAAQIFRAGMLRYGHPLTLMEVLAVFRRAPVAD